LSDQLPVKALVSHYLTNKLIGRDSIQKRIAALIRRMPDHMRYYFAFRRAIPRFWAGQSRVTHPFATRSVLYCYKTNLVRLACLIHAASVRSEPESNSPLKSFSNVS